LHRAIIVDGRLLRSGGRVCIRQYMKHGMMASSRSRVELAATKPYCLDRLAREVLDSRASTVLKYSELGSQSLQNLFLELKVTCKRSFLDADWSTSPANLVRKKVGDVELEHGISPHCIAARSRRTPPWMQKQRGPRLQPASVPGTRLFKSTRPIVGY
jgi:hypothetical protein